MATVEQKRATAAIGILFLLLAACSMIWLAYLASIADLWITVGPDERALNFSWRAVAFFMKTGAAINTIFAVLLTVIGAVVAVISENYKRMASILAISAICLAGIAAATCTLIFVDGETLNALRFYGGFEEDNAKVAERLTGFLAPVIGWLSTLLAAELGISTIAPEGVVRKIIEN